MSGTNERFERVEQISSPGQFMFAKDLVDRSRENDHVEGRRPQIEDILYEFLKDRYPQAECLLRNVGTDVNPVWQIGKWYGQNGRLILGGEHYRIFQGDSVFPEEDIPHFEFQGLNDEGEIERSGPPNFDNKFGLIDVHLLRVEPYKFWRGTVRLEADEPRPLIKDMIGVVNEVIRSQNIPTWRDTQYEAPLSRLGYAPLGSLRS